MQHTRECTSLSQANATILTGFHFASLRHSFTSVAFSPPAAHYFARRLSPFRLRSLSAAPNTSPDTWLIRPSFRHAALSSLASFRRLRTLTGNILRRLHMELASPFVPHGFSASPSWGLAAAFVRRSSSLRLLTAARLQRYSADKFAAQLCFFFCRRRFYRQF